ncbi:P-loop containing nucleoside triphosphate hydrolase protein [Lasiosphaeris hirsuta]|uniref:P-loop containing nucleoside triphosphate hydrolase protein n=1 Tax=Lasiosphaeris hirsuta TaxID=260670 RepID=A0AA40A9R6_9PEZI|nr:P-loop containing nucleoside triphosphate hydrolase protein [Lasiosphaeris hirsuta]
MAATISKTTVQKLFKHECEAGSCADLWSVFSDLSEEQKDVDEKVRNQPIVHRHYFDSKKWRTVNFTINSPDMRALMAKALEDYQDLDLELERWTFCPPFMPIVHRWGRFQELHREVSDASPDSPDSPGAAKKEAVDDLMDFLTPLLAPSVDALGDTRLSGLISWNSIWQIFPPGELVMTKLYGVEVVCRVVEHKEWPGAYEVTMEYLDWNGGQCGFTSTKRNISAYQGITHVTSLPVYPLSFAEDSEAIKRALTHRGRHFEALRGYHFRTYSGHRILINSNDQRPAAGRVVIDAYSYYRSNNLVQPELKWLTGSSTKSFAEPKKTQDDQNQDGMVAVGPKPVSADRFEDLTPLSDEECLLATPWVIGLDLKNKEWGRFFIDNLKDIVWNDKAFDNLVLPGGEKELAWDFVESKAYSKETYDDFVTEKGRGIIILMFGPPGVGKTFTAEAVSERARVPLYSLSAGMLGTDPADVEASLERALELCRMWNAMLLLDEADVFLGARTNDGIARNELVSIFLTKLEYYQGILFLTTNRASTIDHAFQSRVDLFLPYRSLTDGARKTVWQNFINHLGSHRFDLVEADLDKLSKLKLNGREIKNLIKTAQLLSFRSGGKVTSEKLCILAEKRVEALSQLEDY